VVVAGGYVGEGEHFHAFRALPCAVSVGSAAVRALPDRPHIHGQFLCDADARLGKGRVVLCQPCRLARSFGQAPPAKPLEGGSGGTNARELGSVRAAAVFTSMRVIYRT
jgi:hypothetical protein